MILLRRHNEAAVRGDRALDLLEACGEVRARGGGRGKLRELEVRTKRGQQDPSSGPRAEHEVMPVAPTVCASPVPGQSKITGVGRTPLGPSFTRAPPLPPRGPKEARIRSRYSADKDPDNRIRSSARGLFIVSSSHLFGNRADGLAASEQGQHEEEGS